MKFLVLVVVAFFAVAACEKGNETKSQGRDELTSDETAMLAHLPAGNIALVGGNYMRLQKYLTDSPLTRLMGASMEPNVKGMTEWMNCYVEANRMRTLGVLKLSGTQLDMAYVMTGMQLSQLEACAKRAGFPATVDADGKFIAIEMPTAKGPMQTGYVLLPDGMLYTRVSMQFPVTSLPHIDRAMLEQDINSVAKVGGAAADKALMSQIGTVDRSKAVWFVGTGAGTPIANKLGNVHGTFDIDKGIALDVTVQIVDKTLADQIADGVPQAKRQAAAVGGTLKDVVDKLVFARHGDSFHFKLAVDNAQVNALVDQLAPFAHAAQ